MFLVLWKKFMWLKTIKNLQTSRIVILPIQLCRDLQFNPGTHVLVSGDLKGRIILEKVTPKTHPDLFKIDPVEFSGSEKKS